MDTSERIKELKQRISALDNEKQELLNELELLKLNCSTLSN
jgi:hypothetical protein